MAGLYMYRVDENFMFQRFEVRLRDPEAQCTPPAPVTAHSALQHTALRPLRVVRSPFTCGQGNTRSDHVKVHVVSDHGGRSRTVRKNQEQRVHALVRALNPESCEDWSSEDVGVQKTVWRSEDVGDQKTVEFRRLTF